MMQSFDVRWISTTVGLVYLDLVWRDTRAGGVLDWDTDRSDWNR